MARDLSAELVQSILRQAKYFLNEAEEFYPFGAMIDSDGQLKPVGFFVDDEFPDSAIVLIELEKEIKSGIEENRYQQGAIGIDTFVTLNHDAVVEEKTAIEIRIYGTGTFTTKQFIYFKDSEGYQFEE